MRNADSDTLVEKFTARRFLSRNVFQNLSLVFALLASCLLHNVGQAETVRLLADINQSASDTDVRQFQSNGQVAFFYRNGFWRASGSTIKKIDLPVPASAFREFAATQNFFYYTTAQNQRTTLWRISADGKRYVVIARNLVGDISRALVHPGSGEIYFGQNTDRGLQIWKINNRKRSIDAFAFKKGSCFAKCIDNIAITTSNIFFVFETQPVYEEQDFPGGALWALSLRTKSAQVVDRWFHVQSQDFDVVNNLLFYSRNEHTDIDNGPRESCVVGRSNGQASGTVLLTAGEFGFGDNHLDSLRAPDSSCYLDVQAVDSNTVVFQRILGNRDFEPPTLLGIEIWRSESRRNTATKVATVFQNPQISQYEGCSADGRGLGRVCSLNMQVVDGYVWFSNIILSATDTSTAKHRVSVLDLSTGAITPVVEGDWNHRLQYRRAGDRMLIVDSQLRPVKGSDGLARGGYELVAKSVMTAQFSGQGFQELVNHPELSVVGSTDAWVYLTTPKSFGSDINFEAINLQTGAITQQRTFKATANKSGINQVEGFFGQGGIAYFCAEGSAPPNDRISSIWRSDGSRPSTMVAIQQVGQETAAGLTDELACRNIAVSAQHVYYTRRQPDSGLEIWRADLDGADQRLLVELTPGPQSSSIESLHFINGKLLVTAGLGGGPLRWIAITPEGQSTTISDESEKIQVVGETADRLIFTILQRRFNEDWYQLWETDGTANGTRRILNGSARLFTNVVTLNNRSRYFYGVTLTDSGDRTLTGLIRVIPGNGVAPVDPVVRGRNVTQGTHIADRYFRLLNHRDRIYLHDSMKNPPVNRSNNVSSIIRLIDHNTGSAQVIALTRERSRSNESRIKSVVSWRNRLYFFVVNKTVANGTTSGNWQIWRSNGIPRTSKRIFQHNVVSSHGNNNRLFYAAQNGLLFSAERKGRGKELWRITP